MKQVYWFSSISVVARKDPKSQKHEERLHLVIHELLHEPSQTIHAFL